MRRDFVAQTAWFAGIGSPDLVTQGLDFADQEIDLLLLAKYGAIQFIQQFFRITDLDFQIGQARFHSERLSFEAEKDITPKRRVVASFGVSIFYGNR